MKRKVGRPKKPENKSYTERVNTLFTKEEKELIEKEARDNDISVNKFLRDIILSYLKKKVKK